MKKIVTISIVLVLSLPAFAQKPQTVEDIDAWVQNEIKAAHESFRRDSIAFISSKIERLNQKIKDIGVEAEKLKKKLEKKPHPTKGSNNRVNGVDEGVSIVAAKPETIAPLDTIDVKPQVGAHDGLQTSPATINQVQQASTSSNSPSKAPSNNGTVAPIKRGCKELLNKLTGEDEILITRQFLHDFIAMSDDIGQYVQIKDDLAEIDRLLVQRNLKLEDFESFIGDLKIVSFADSVLGSPYDKAKRVEAQSKLKSVKFATDKQRKCSLADSLRHGLDIYFLSTSNMMDLITEITECHKKYFASETDEERVAVSKELTSSIEFDARVKNFRSVKYMSDIYDKIISEILCYDENDEFVFQEFNMDGLLEIKASLELMRQQK